MKIQKLKIQKLIILVMLSIFFTVCFKENLLAKVKKTTLPNGLTIISKEDHSQPILAMQIWVKVGSIDENEDTSGISHFIEHMLFKGSSNLQASEAAKIIESKGGIINAATSKDLTYYHIVIASEYFNTAINVLSNAVMNAIFPIEELEKERLVILEEIKRKEDNPQAYIWNLFNENIYNDHSYSHDVLGTVPTIENITQAMLLDYYHKFYIPNNMTLVIVGDFDNSVIIPKLKDIFANWTKKELTHKEQKSIEQQSLNIEEKRDIHVAYLMFGTLGPNVKSKDQYAMDVLSYILGSGRSSRLYRKLQEEEKLVHSIGVSFITFKEQGPFYVTAVCDPDKIPLVRQAVIDELSKIKQEKISTRELNKTKAILKSEYLLGNQTYNDQAFGLGHYETIYTYKFNQSYSKRIGRVTANDVLKAANKYIDLDKIVFVVLKP